MAKGLAVVTGASSGIGWEMGRQLAARGYDLLLVARREERLRSLAAEIDKDGKAHVEYMRADLTNRADRRELIARMAKDCRRISILVNNAGFGAVAAAQNIPMERCLEMIELNMAALTELSLEAARLFAANRTGAIINVASTAAFQPVPFMSLYAATKAFVLSFTEALAEEMHVTGVRVMALCPGYTRTEFQQIAGEASGRPTLKHCMSAEVCVRIGLADFDSGKRVSITGAANKLQTFASWLFPRSLVVRAAGAFVKGRI